MLVETTYRRYQASTWRFWILPERIRTMNISPSHVLFRHSTPPSNVIFSPGLMFDSVLLSSIPRFYNFQTPSLIVPVSRFDLQWKFEGDKIGSCCSRWKNKFNKILERLNGKILNSNEINNPSATGRQQVAENWNGAPAHEHWQNVTRKKWKGWRRKWRLPENNRHLWKCDVCDVVMNGVKQVLDHLRGRTHARKSRQVRLAFFFLDKSFRDLGKKYLC